MIKQRPLTAKCFVFFTMEDEDGLKDVFVKPDVCGRSYKLLRNCFLLIVEGTIQKQGGILNVLAEGAVGIQNALSGGRPHSFDPAPRSTLPRPAC